MEFYSILYNNHYRMESMHILLFTYRAYIVVGIYIYYMVKPETVSASMLYSGLDGEDVRYF